MTGRKATQAPATTAGALPPANDLRTAVLVARRMLADHADPAGSDVYAYAQAHGGLCEALRILLRALDGPDTEKGSAPVRTLGGDQRRCPAAHPEDPTPCGGPVVVTVLDVHNTGADGCEHHAAQLLASLTGGRLVPKPDAPAGVALRIFRAAHHTRPFPWVDAPRTQPSQLSDAENLGRGEDQ